MVQYSVGTFPDRLKRDSGFIARPTGFQLSLECPIEGSQVTIIDLVGSGTATGGVQYHAYLLV